MQTQKMTRLRSCSRELQKLLIRSSNIASHVTCHVSCWRAGNTILLINGQHVFIPYRPLARVEISPRYPRTIPSEIDTAQTKWWKHRTIADLTGSPVHDCRDNNRPRLTAGHLLPMTYYYENIHNRADQQHTNQRE